MADININVKLAKGKAKKQMEEVAKSFGDNIRDAFIKSTKSGTGMSGFLGGIRKGAIGTGAGGAGVAGAAGGALGGAALGLGAMGIVADGVMKVVDYLSEASGMLKGVLGAINKGFQLILKPLGDMLGIALMPLLGILRPIGVFFNTLMKPYLKKAMAAMKAGNVLMKGGDIEGAMGAYAVGFAYMAKPLFDGIVDGLAGMYSLVTEGLRGLGNIIIDVFASIFGESSIGWIRDSWNGIMDSVQDTIKGGAQGIKEWTTEVLDVQLGQILAKAEDVATGSGKNMVDSLTKSLGSANTIKGAYETKLEEIYEVNKGYLEELSAKTEEEAVKMKKTTDDYFGEGVNSIATVFHNFAVNVKAEMEEVLTGLTATATASSGGGSWIEAGASIMLGPLYGLVDSMRGVESGVQ